MRTHTVIVWKGEKWRAKEEEEEGSPLGQDLSLEEEEDGVLERLDTRDVSGRQRI